MFANDCSLTYITYFFVKILHEKRLIWGVYVKYLSKCVSLSCSYIFRGKLLWKRAAKTLFISDFVKSHNLFGDAKHTPGVVLAEIVKPNIPVKNGVIHLIHKPLMVVDSTVRDLLQVRNY